MNERRTTYDISWPTSYSASQLQLFTSSELVGAWLTMSLEPFPRPGAFQRCLETPVSTNDIRLTFRFLGGLWRTGQNRLIIHSINHIQRTRYCGVSRWKSPSGCLDYVNSNRWCIFFRFHWCAILIAILSVCPRRSGTRWKRLNILS